MLAVQRETAALGVELPEAIRVGRDLQDVAGMPVSHVGKLLRWCGQCHSLTYISVLVSPPSVSMCSSIWVTRKTSSMVVSPFLTLVQPSVRNVRIPCST